MFQAFRWWSEEPPSLLPDCFICSHPFTTPHDLTKPGTGYLVSCPLYTSCTLQTFVGGMLSVVVVANLIYLNQDLEFGPSLFSLFLTSLRCVVSPASCNVRHQPFTQFNPAVLTLCGYFRLGTSLETSTGLEG